jgi:hypothetical protein
MKNFISILGKQLKNNMNGKLPTIAGRTLYNANGDIDPTSAGYKYLIDTMSYIRGKVIDQKFYEISIADYLPMDVGEAAWSEEIIQNLAFTTGGDFFTGDTDTGEGNGRIANVDAALSKVRMPVKTWVKATNWTIIEIAKAAAANNWNVVETKLKSLKKNWDLGIQEVAFLGHNVDTLVTGLLNDSEVNKNTSLITEPLSTMSETEFTAFVAGLLPAYYTNSNSTTLPDTFIMPTDDYLGMIVPYSSTYPNISKIQYLTDAMRRATGNASFEIKGLTYAQNEINSPRGINKNRYVLYKNDPETLSMSIPVDLTILDADSANKFQWQQVGYGQYSGALINRKREVLYIDETPT